MMKDYSRMRMENSQSPRKKNSSSDPKISDSSDKKDDEKSHRQSKSSFTNSQIAGTDCEAETLLLMFKRWKKIEEDF
jgi:hypothetical protein